MQIQDSLGIPDSVLVIFRVVPPKERKGASAHITVQITNFVLIWYFCQDDHPGLDLILEKAGRLPQKAIDRIHVALGKHCRDRIILGGEIKELEIIRLRTSQPGVVAGIYI